METKHEIGGTMVWKKGRQQILICVKYLKLTFVKTTNVLTDTTHRNNTQHC